MYDEIQGTKVRFIILSIALLRNIGLHLNLNNHTRNTQLSNTNTSPRRLMIRHPLTESLNHQVERARERNVIAPDRVDVSPTSCASVLKVLLDVLEGKIDLASKIFLVDVALVVPAALAGALDGVADADGLGVGVFFVVGLADAFVVVVCEMRHCDGLTRDALAGCSSRWRKRSLTLRNRLCWLTNW